jgi:glc operon protein GlcG
MTTEFSMFVITLAQASEIVDATLKKVRDLKQMPQTVVVLDTGGHVVCAMREDGSGIIRFEAAIRKAYARSA